MAKISQLRYTIFILCIKWHIYFSKYMIFHFLQYLVFIRVLIFFLHFGAFPGNYSDSLIRESSRMTKRRTKWRWTIDETSGCHCAARQSARPSLLRKHWHSSVEFFSELVALAKIGHARNSTTIPWNSDIGPRDNARNFKSDNGARRILVNDFAPLHL